MERLASLILLTIGISVNGDFPCNKTIYWTDNNAQFQVSYNLCAYQIRMNNQFGYWRIYDNRPHGYETNYSYYFNIANNVQSTIPDNICYNLTAREMIGLPVAYCDKIISNSSQPICSVNDYVAISGNVGAYQIHEGNQNCYRLHDGVTAPIWSLIDDSDPTEGVALTYINGDFCAAGGKNREFRINFRCSNEIANSPNMEQDIFESSICEYEFTMNTYRGCPAECPVVNDKLCSDHGACEFDFAVGKPKCFCYSGWSGEDCNIVFNDTKTNQCDAPNPLIINNTRSQGSNLYDGCVFNLTDSHGIWAEYDLTWFNLNNEIFTVNDPLNPYVYKFNICGKIPTVLFTDNTTIPATCIKSGTSHGPCVEIHQNNEGPSVECVNLEDVTGKTASAVQISPDGYCYWIGSEVDPTYQMNEFSVSLYDVEDAGKGVIYTILNGEWCDEGQKNRELRIRLICPDDNRIEFGTYENNVLTEVVYEDPICIYNIYIESPLACPNRCITRNDIDSFSVCATNGICRSDPFTTSVRCLCDDGYCGTVCETQITTEPTMIPLENGQTYNPTKTPTINPTIPPTRSPLQSGETYNPTMGPTKFPTIHSLKTSTRSPILNPTRSPLQDGKTYNPTRGPLPIEETHKPTRNHTTTGTEESNINQSQYIGIGIGIGIGLCALLLIILGVIYYLKIYKDKEKSFVALNDSEMVKTM